MFVTTQLVFVRTAQSFFRVQILQNKQEFLPKNRSDKLNKLNKLM